MIAFEGPDNAGKSTLAKYVCEKYGLAYCTAGPAPKNEIELDQCLVDQYLRLKYPIVQDRLTCISHQVYHESDNTEVEIFLQMAIKYPKFTLVYCRPSDRTLMDFSTHKIKSYDTEVSLKKIADNQHLYISRYDDIMARIPHVIYDWTDPDLNRDSFSDMVMATQYDESEWHRLQQQVAINGMPK